MPGDPNNTTHVPGNHYSGKNPIPNIQKFIQSLDADKADRDKRIDEELKARKAQGEIHPHVEDDKAKAGSKKWVTDPVTGKEVQIEDVDQNFAKAVREPMLSVPNANLPGGENAVSKEFFQMSIYTHIYTAY
jgi:Ca2+-dependent lipid-binding protein